MPRAGLDSAAVVSAAAELADHDGLERLTLARLARRLNVRTPSLYAHVAGLEDLRARLAVRGARMLAEVSSRAATGRARDDALRAFADAYRAFAHDHLGTYAAIQRAPDPGDAEAQAAAGAVLEVLAAVLRGYGLEDEDAIHGMRMVRSTLHGFVSLEASGGFGLPISLDESWDRLIATLDRGLASSS